MDFTFLFILLGVAAAFVVLALVIHRLKERRRYRFSDPRRDRVYHNK